MLAWPSLAYLGNLEPLLASLQDAERRGRALAAYALGRVGDVRAVEPLVAALQDEEIEVCLDAATVLGRLWSDHLDEAKEHLQISREVTEQSGDLTLLARALSYLTIVYRKRGDVERVRALADDRLRVAAEAHMPRYIRMAHAAYAWLAWREGDTTETVRQAQAAIEDWGDLRTYPYRWLALFPLIGVALQHGDTAMAISWGQHLIRAPQQRLPDELTQRLEEAVTAWEHNQADMTTDLLWKALRLAQTMHYV